MKLRPLLRVLPANVCSLSVAFTQNSTEPENHGIVVAYMDRSVKPGDDFHRYANGGWIKRTEIPPECSARTIYVGAEEPANSDSFTECHLGRAVRFCSAFCTKIEFNLPS